MDKKTYQYLAIGAGIIIVLAMLGYWDPASLIPGQVGPAPTAPPSGGGPTAPPSGTILSAKAQWSVREVLSKTAAAAGDTVYVSVARADSGGYFDLLDAVEETEMDAVPDTSAAVYNSGNQLLIAVSSDDDPTHGYECYPRWFYIENLQDGAHIKALPLGNPKSALQEFSGGSGGYVYKVNSAACQDTGQVASWLEGSTPYWLFGTQFDLYGRIAKDYLIQQMVNKGVIGMTLNDGATWEDSEAEINANWTATADQEDIYFQLIGEAADHAFGIPTLAVTTSGQVQQYNAVLIFATNATSLNPQPLIDDGWVQISKVGMTASVAFYHEIHPEDDGCIPSSGNVITLSIPITLSDAGLGASEYENIMGWVLDWQQLSNVQNGQTTTTVPTGIGFLTEVGSDSIVEPLALTVSSGAAATPQLYGHWITN